MSGSQFAAQSIEQLTPFHDINQQLQEFCVHTLDDLADANLMERVDIKFLISPSSISDLLADIKELCSVLVVDGRRISHYRTHYYDSEDLRYYHAHHNGLLNRYKVRCRNYVELNSPFLEVKLKNNKRHTIKERIPIDAAGLPALTEHREFLLNRGIERIDELVETQVCDYFRVAFTNWSRDERITLDFDLNYSDSDGQRRVAAGDIAVIELKQAGYGTTSKLHRLFRRHRLRASSFSKYCIGLCLLRNGEIKCNRFKRTLLRMEKIKQQANKGHIHV